MTEKLSCARTDPRLATALATLLAVGCGPRDITRPDIAQDSGGPEPRVEAELEPAVDPTSVEALRAHVDFLTELDPPRTYGEPESLERAAQYIAATFESAKGKVTRQEFVVGGSTYANVSCHFGPEEGARLIVGAHYDSYADMPGADDNASGVAVLLALAHGLHELELTVPVELVAYALEEPPQFQSQDMGSMRHAQQLADEKAEVLGMICLEMLGYYSEEPGSQSYPADALELLYGDKADFLAVVGRPADKSLVETVYGAMQGTELRVVQLLSPPELPGVDFSDHSSYWSVGFPALMITDTAFYRNPHYHEPTDTAETLDYERMVFALEGVRAAIVELAGGR